MCILQCLGYCSKSYVRVLTQSNTLTIARGKAAKALKEEGETPEELLRSIKENEAVVAEAQRVVDAWKAIVGEKGRREEAAKAEAERIATEKAEAERKAAEERERAEKEEKARIEAEKAEEEARVEAERKAEEERIAKQKTEEAESDKEEAEKRMDDEEPKPVGSGVFGNIYNQFKGKVKEAFDFLMKHKGGDLLGVFHRKDVGDIDLVWGDHGGGLAHIIRRHIIEQNDFKNVDEIQKVIEDVIRNGLIVRENKDKINIEYNGYRVSIKKTIRDSKGNVVENKNWIVTAFDKSKPKHEKRNPSSSETLTTPSANQKADGVTLPSNEDSIDKGSKKAEKKQKKQSVFDKAKEIADKEEKKRKAEAEDDSVIGQATRAVGKKKKVNLFKYTASEKNSNSALRGVHYANGYAYASDGYILFKEKADYPKEWEGTTRDKDGNLIDGKYPDTEKAILRFVHIPDKEVESLPSKEVLDFAIAASKKLKVESIPVAIDGLFFNAVNLKKFLEAVASKGVDKVVYRHPMLYATNGKDEIVLMPTVNTLEGALDIADRMESAGLPKEQIDAWKAHIEAADKKMSFEDFQNAEKNAKRKGVRLTEAESPKRKADERYQRGEGGVKPSKAEVALRDAVIDRLRESGMDVIADEAEGQRVLDEVNGRAKVQMGDAPETFAERQKQAVESHGVVMPGLNESYVEVVKDIPRHEYTGSIAEATREAIDAAKRKYAGKELTYNNYGANFNYTISANAIDICLSPKHQNLSANKGIHLALAEHLDEVINKSVEVEEHPDYIKGKDGKRGEEVNPNAIMHRFYGVAVIDGTPCRVMTLMREDGRSEEANGVHSYEVQKIEVLDNESPSTSNGVGTQMKDLSAYPLAKLLKGVEKSYDKGKYLLDESKKRSVGLREQRVDGADGVRFFRTANGEAYGFTVGGRIYIDPRIATSETPVHEYAHLWAEALRNGNPKEWQNVVELMKGTKVWDEVKARYPELKSDDEIADEVIATYSGRRGAERLREEQRKIAEGNGGVFEKAEAVNALERVKQALKKFWNGVADFLHIHYKSAEEVADRVMKDLLEGVDPRKMGKTKDGGVRFSAKQKRALETASLGNVPRSLTVVSSAAGANVLNNIENLAKEFEKSATQPKTFIGDVAKALGASRFGSGSEYATFETKNGNIVTIRLANHNAHVSGFDHNDKDNGISIVISPKPNEGITNDGNAHITEFYYDSIKLRRAEGKPLAEIVRSIKQALYSGEFKDTTGLAERQEVNGEDVIRYQSSSENSDKTLAGVHNITEEKLRKALKLGGLANPSVAVIDISKNSHEGFGEISLILPSEKVAKRTGKNAGTWQGDAWTPTYPQIERRMSNKGAEKASKDVLSVPSDMYSEVRIGLDRWLDSGEANSAMAYMFLHEKGVAPEPKKIQPKFSDEAYNELKSITAGNFNIYGISKADAQKVLAMYIDAYFDGDKDLYEDKTKAWLEKNRSIVDAGDKGGMRYAIAKENVKLYDEYGFNYRGVQTFVRDVEYDHRNTGVDMNATLNEVEDYIKTNSLTDEFNTWQEGKEKEYGIKEVIFDGFTPSGNRRYIPNTLENVSKIMKKQGRNGATGAWASFPNFAARLMPSYGTLEDIRSKKGLLTSDREKIDDFREKWSKVFFELGMKCQPDATGTFDDYGFDRLSEAAMTSDPQAFLKQEYNVDFSDEDTKRLKKMVKAIKEEYPAMYFETKFERPVYLNEFAAVVVPNDLGADVKKALSDLGIAMYEYDASKEGDRSRAFDEAVKSSGKIRFQFIGEKGAAEADHAEEVFANENVERSVRESRSEKTDLTAEERELRDNLVERMRKGGLDVVTDSEEMQRVIDTENERTRNKRSKKSEAARKRDEALYAVDWSTAFVSGKSREEATEIRRERGRKFKEETKELYGRVLSGNFDDVTLRLIDKFVDNSTPNNPYERPISKRLPARALQKMRGRERTGSIDALFSRISESAVGKDGKALPRAERERAIEEKKKELLKKWAIATGNWHTDIADFTDQREPIGSGTDSDVYLGKDGKSVIKVSKGKPYGKRFRPDVDNVALFNTVFPGSRYTIEGYGEIDGKFVRFLKQPIVDFTSSTPLTEGERVAYMEKLGFKPINKENTAFSNGEIIASDLQKSNIVKDKQGNVRVIDADMKLHTKDFGGKFSYPDAETDTRTDGMQRFLRTVGGEVYGLVKDGRIYLDPKVATAETAVHEYTHLWGDMLRRKDSEQWSHTVKELKNSVLWEEVKELYPELKTDDEIADEVLSTFSGRRGAERLREEARRVADGEGGVFTKAKAIETLERVKEAIARFWEGVARMFGINRYRSAEELADMAMRDLINGVKPTSRTFTFDNFYKDTKAVFEGTERPKGKPDYTSYSGSEYWYGEDIGGKYVVRGSDHWSGEFKVKDGERTNVGRNHYSEITEDGMLPIGAQGSLKFGWEKGLSKPVGSGISAAIDRRGSGDSNNIASCYWYIDNAKGKDNKGFTYGKAYLSEFEDKERRRDIPGDDWRDIQGLEGGTRAMAVKKANDRFNEELELQVKGELEEGHVYKLGMPSEILLSTGVPNLPIELSAKQLSKKAADRGHRFDVKDIANLPQAIQAPIAVFEYGNKDKSQNLIVEIERDGKKFVVGIHFNQNRRGIVVNDIRGLFNKDSHEWLNWISQGKLLYADKEKIQALMDKQRTNLAEVNYLNLDDVAKKVKDFENPKLFDGKISEVDKKGSDSIDRSVRENPKNEDKPRFSRKPGESIFDYASRVSEDVDRSVRERVSARDEYEKKVKSKGFQTKEALQNSMLGLQEFMYAIDHASGNKRYIEDIPDFENPILGENRLSSVNKEEMHQVAKTQFKPLMSAVAKLSGNGKESGELYDYMFAKHGLERDAVMRQREAQKEFDKYQKANPKGTKTIGDFVASLEGKDYAGLTALTAEDGRVKSIQSQIDAIDEQMKATDDQLLLRKLGGQKKRLNVDLLNAARDAADDIRKAFESNPSHDRSDINELWSRVNEVNGNTLRKLYESGMLTKEAYNDISSMYTNYIPMRGFDQTTSADAYAYLTHGDSAEPRNT